MRKIGKDHFISLDLLSKMVLRCLVFLFLMVSIAIQVKAEVLVDAQPDRSEVAVGEPFFFIVSVKTTGDEEVIPPDVPGSIANIFGGRNQSVSSSHGMQIINNKVTYQNSKNFEFTFQFTPDKEGVLEIPPFEIKAGGKVYKTEKHKLQVLKAGTVTQRPQRNDDPFADERDEIFNQLLQRRGLGLGGRGLPDPSQRQDPGVIRNPPKNSNETFSIRLEVDKNQVYEGEQISANWYIYTRANILSLDRQKFPELRGFWKETIEEVPALNFSQVVVNGTVWNRALLASHALFPIKAGNAVIDEYKVKAQVQIPDGTFGGFGFGKPYTFARSSERVPIKVLPLPLDGRPQDFAGAVGKFNVKASVEGKQFPVGQPFSLKVRFEGSGNAKLIELPGLNLPPSLENYSTKNESKFFKNGDSYKEFEVLLIPRQQGPVTIPALSFSIFDPATKQYKRISTEPIDLEIIENKNAPANPNPILAQEKPAQNQKPEQLVLLQEKPRSTKWSLQEFIGWLALFGLIITSAIYYYRIKLGGGIKKVRTRAKLERRLRTLKNYSDKKDIRAFGAEGANLIYFILGEVSGEKSAGLELKKLLQACPPSLRVEVAGEIEKLMEDCQILGFAPDELVSKSSQGKDLGSIYAKLEKVLIKASEY